MPFESYAPFPSRAFFEPDLKNPRSKKSLSSQQRHPSPPKPERGEERSERSGWRLTDTIPNSELLLKTTTSDWLLPPTCASN